MADLVARLHRAFVEYDYKWKINDRLTVPSEIDLEQTIDKAKELLYAEPVPSQLQVGRLIIRRHADNKFDVYLHIGDIND